jgi:hypothetical protein
MPATSIAWSTWSTTRSSGRGRACALEEVALEQRPLGLVLAAERAVARPSAEPRSSSSCASFREERDAERDADDAVRARELAELIVRQVPRMRVERLASEWLASTGTALVSIAS